MKIHSAMVKGLFGRENPISVEFNEDLNIITGRNGAGKTTFLKLLWYVVSGNVSQALAEIDFDSIAIETDEYECKIFKLNSSTCKGEFRPANKTRPEYIEDVYGPDDFDIVEDARSVLAERLTPIGASLFFPTFRRIEGGFTTGGKSRYSPNSRPPRDLEEAMSALSRKLTNDDHKFISSISTIDIESMLLRNYANLSEESNKLQQNVSNEIIETIRSYRREMPTATSSTIRAADEVIDGVQQKVESMERERQAILAPLNAIQDLSANLFQHSGIKFGARLSFGEAASAISSDALSAGEKQMLSFICYNAFLKDNVIIIDEPELSLHVDWQRQIFRILKSQGSNNQFIVATHSPFIYSKYPDKEVCIDPEMSRGDEDR